MKGRNIALAGRQARMAIPPFENATAFSIAGVRRVAYFPEYSDDAQRKLQTDRRDRYSI
jgi:hypothetical protein